MGEWLEVPSTYALSFKSEQEGVLWQWIAQTQTNRVFWEAGAAIWGRGGNIDKLDVC